MDIVSSELRKVQELTPFCLNFPIVVAYLRSVLKIRCHEEISSQYFVRLDVIMEINADIGLSFGN